MLRLLPEKKEYLRGGEKFSSRVPCADPAEGEATVLLADSNKKYYAGIDLGGTFVKCGIVSEEGKILKKAQFPTGRERPYTEIAADMAKCVKELEEELGVRVCAAGVGSPGTVDSEHGVIIYANNIQWKNVPLAKAVEEELHVPVFSTNDANAAALGECLAGGGADFHDMLFITLGTGVGGGVVLGGKLFEGNRSAGAELGHIVIKAGGEKCTCGRRGCFEAYSSATALIRRTVRAMRLHPESKLWEVCGDESKVDGKTAFSALALGDKTAKRVISDYVRMLAEGLSNLANIFRPQAILLGGGVSAAGDALLKPLKRAFDRRLYGGKKYAPVELKVATLGNDAGLIGAALFAASRM